MKLLDLFAGAGGAAMGYHRAGFDDIVGVDIVPQPNYPFTFIQGDALRPPVRLESFDLIHASPPCQAYSTSTREPWRHPDLVALTRDLIGDHPYVIENVRGAPLRAGLMLCGSMFGLDIQRHRYFETPYLMLPPPCHHVWLTGRAHTVTGHAAGRNGQWNRHSRKYADLAEAQQLMDMPWARTVREVTEAIPPAYTTWIGEQFIAQRRAA